jgi:outer membrane cobalamin receptor
VFARPQTPKAADWEAGENPALPRNCKRVKSDCQQLHRLRTAGHCALAIRMGRPLGLESSGLRTYSPSQETGANTDKNPFRVKRRIVMRTIRALFLLAFFSATLVFQLSASEIKIQIVDPHSALVGSARVTLYRQAKAAPIAVRSATANGVAEFRDLQPGRYRVQVLAPGFAPETQEIALEQTASLTVHLKLANAEQTVSVTAAATPATGAETSSNVSVIEAPELQSLQPTSMGEILRFAPGAVISDTGQRGGLTSLFVRGGDSTYNKVIIDGVPVNEPGGTFDFGVISLPQVDRIELLRGSQSTLYGSDAMTSVVQVFSRTGTTRVPLFTFGADGGTFATGHGYGSLSGAVRHFDYNVFADQFNTQGKGANDDYSNSTEGANLGYAFSPKVQFRFRTRHTTSRTGGQGEYNFSQGVQLPAGDSNLPPNTNEFFRQNNFLASGELSVAAGRHWYHRFSGYEYNHRDLTQQGVPLNPLRVAAFVDFCPDTDAAGNAITCKTTNDYNRAGFNYQGEYWARDWARTVFGYEFEDENGFFLNDPSTPPPNHGLRRNHALYGQELISWKRLSVQAGARYVHNEYFGNYGVPRVAASYLLVRGGEVLSGTRLRGSYSEGIKEPNFYQTFGEPLNGIVGNPNLKPEQNNAFEAGLSQAFLNGKYSLDAVYFDNRFHNQITGVFNLQTFKTDYVNLNKSLAHGAELTVQARPTARLQVRGSYVYDSTQIVSAPEAPTQVGSPFLLRPKHSGNALVSYTRQKFGATLGGTFIGRRRDSDFFALPVPLTQVAGYARLDAGGWYKIKRYVTAYANVENLLNQHFENVLGYPALTANVRAGLRFTLGGE